MVDATGRPTPGPVHRAIILGASNARLGISVAIESARHALGQPLDVMAAIGLGRSYGISSSVLGRTLDGILDCGLWSDLEQRAPLPTTALLTDFGNDIVYEISPEQTAKWIEACLQRLSTVSDRLIVTTLPIESVEKLSRWRFLLMRTIYFPKCRLDLRTVLSNARRLNELILEAAERFHAHVVHPCPEWFGFDSIHIRGKYRREAWKKIFSSHANDFNKSSRRHCWSEWVSIHRLRPLRKRIFGWQQRTAQPAGKLRDGTTISLY